MNIGSFFHQALQNLPASPSTFEAIPLSKYLQFGRMPLNPLCPTRFYVSVEGNLPFHHQTKSSKRTSPLALITKRLRRRSE